MLRRADPAHPLPGAVGTHADEVVAMAAGRTLVLWGVDLDAPALPPAVTEVVRHRGPGTIDGTFDAVVSLGQLAAAQDLAGLLAEIAGHVAPDGVLLFCEPTASDTSGGVAARHDITGALWAGAWSVIDCRRFRVGRGRGAEEYCWGRARLTRFVGPRRRPAGPVS